MFTVTIGMYVTHRDGTVATVLDTGYSPAGLPNLKVLESGEAAPNWWYAADVTPTVLDVNGSPRRTGFNVFGTGIR